MTYAIAEVFKTLQGEGMHAGRSAVFVRFAGCNLWSGQDKDRQRDAMRSGAQCPLWCDTDFLRTATMDIHSLMTMIMSHSAELVVFTGGEPLLQLDEALVKACCLEGFTTCIETNGTARAGAGVLEALDHVCVSPKRPPASLPFMDQLAERRRQSGWITSELKVVYPEYNPLEYTSIRRHFTRCYVSPVAATASRGVSCVQKDIEQRAADFCLSNPGWALSLQTHKHLELP